MGGSGFVPSLSVAIFIKTIANNKRDRVQYEDSRSKEPHNIFSVLLLSQTFDDLCLDLVNQLNVKADDD